MGWFFDTAAYQTDYLLKTFFRDKPAAFGLWVPNLLFFAACACRHTRRTAQASPRAGQPAYRSLCRGHSGRFAGSLGGSTY